MLAVIACHYNPNGYVRPVYNFNAFYRAIGPHHVYTIEAAFPGQVAVSPHCTIGAGPQNIMWQKERLLSLAISHLPAYYDQVAWVDADMLFTNPCWREIAADMLDAYPVCHLFEAVCETDQDGRIINRRHGVGWRWKNDRADTKTWFRPGGAWAARREIAETCLYDLDILGGGDCGTVFAWTGEYERYNRHRACSPEWSRHYLSWARQQHEMVQGRIGCVPGDVVHLWHGDIDNRQYVTRPQILADHKFNPFVDIRIGPDGLWEWASDKPELHAAVRKYFVRRREDG